jgi:hypothetical protein
MPEWWTYGLSDFLLFSPRTYYRMLERHNEAVWPVQILTLGLGLAILGVLRHTTPGQGRIVSTIVAGLWAWVAWSFFWTRYATINWAAVYFALLFAIEALLFIWIGIVGGRLRYRADRSAAGGTGIALLVLGLAIYPLFALLLRRPWRQTEIFGVFPDPTAIATAGLLLLADGLPRGGLLVVPLLWCGITGATLWAMGSAEAIAAPLAALLAVVAATRPHRLR